MAAKIIPTVWFPALRANSGADIFTMQLADRLSQQGIRAEITWLPHRSEYAPWSVPIPEPPGWANIVHINTWLNKRFIPRTLPVVATEHLCIHDPAVTPYKSKIQAAYHRHWIKPNEYKVIKNANRVAGVSKYTSRQTEKCFGLGSVTTIYNGVDTELFRPSARIRPRKPFRLLYVGNWIKRKGVDLLPHIMNNLGPDYELHFTESRYRNVQSTALTKNMESIDRINSTHQMKTVYQEADALLFPTRLEGLPLSAIEAQACGLPVIATNGSSLPEAVIHNETGILCEQDNVSAFADAARRLAVDPEAWRRMRAAARSHVENHFTINRMVERYLHLYSEILQN